MTDSKTYEQGVSDCWDYLYYELGMKDLADEMYERIYTQQREQSDDQRTNP